MENPLENTIFQQREEELLLRAKQARKKAWVIVGVGLLVVGATSFIRLPYGSEGTTKVSIVDQTTDINENANNANQNRNG